MRPKTQTIATLSGFAECPRWRGGEVWFTLGNRIMIVSTDGKTRVFGEIEGKLALGLDFFADGSALSGSAFERLLYRLYPDGNQELFADLSGEIADIMNECIIGVDGNVYVGSVGFNLLKGEGPRPTKLVRVSPDGSVSRVGPEMTMPNGMVLDEDGRTLYVAESIGEKITRLVIADDGDVSFDGVVADLRGRNGSQPDGFALAPDGSIYYADPALPDGGIVHVDAAGRELERFTTGLRHATSCVVGGADGRTLYVTVTGETARIDDNQSQPAAIISVDLNQ